MAIETHNRERAFWCFLALTFLLCGCATTAPQPYNQADEIVVTSTPLVIFSPSSTATIFVVSTETSESELTPIPISTSTPVPSPTKDTRLEPYYWRDWPVVPEFSPNAKEILLQAGKNPALDIDSFVKVGDCQMTSDTFLGGYVRGQYPIPSGLEKTVEWFSDGMVRDSVTSYGGLGVNSVLNPMFAYAAGYKECDPKETPLSCELRVARPVVVVIGLGTNWKPNAEISFEEYLREVVDQVLDTGALPILSTKADNVELDWKLNLAIAKIAYDYDIPMVNIWRSVQDLPNRGLLEPPKQIYLTPDGWMRRNQAWLNTLHQVYILLNNE
jgi:hypothetical protein